MDQRVRPSQSTQVEHLASRITEWLQFNKFNRGLVACRTSGENEGNRMEFLLNGSITRADGVAANTTLLEYLRANGLTGIKEGCAEGECGACAVAMVAPNVHGSRYRAVNSCLMFLPSVAGQEVYTVE